MPRGDRTGPLGYGPRTGRGLGICGFPAGRAAFAGRGFGVGRGVGFGRGFGPKMFRLKERFKRRFLCWRNVLRS